MSRRIRWFVIPPVLLFVFGALVLSCGGGSSGCPSGEVCGPPPTTGFQLQSIEICFGSPAPPTPTPSPTPKTTPTLTPCPGATSTAISVQETINFIAQGTFTLGTKTEILGLTDNSTTLWTSSNSQVLLPPLSGQGGQFLGQSSGCACVNASSGSQVSLPVGVAVETSAADCICPTPAPTPAPTPKAGAVSASAQTAEATSSSAPGAGGNSAGVLMWRYDAGARLGGPIVPAPNGHAYFITENGVLHAIDSLGHSAFTRLAGGSTVAVAPDNTIYAAGTGGDIEALDADGVLEWKADSGGAANILAAGDGYGYAAVGNELVAASAPGQVDWRVALAGIPLAVLPTSEGLLVGTSNGAVSALSSDGVVQWSFTPTGGFAGQLAASDSAAYVGAGGGIYAIDLRTGSELWHVGTGHSITSGPAVGSSGNIYVGAGPLIAIDPDGHVAWSVDAVTPGNTPLAATTGGGVFGVGSDGLAAAIAADGGYIWTTRSFSKVTSAAASSSGVIYVGTDAGRIFAIR